MHLIDEFSISQWLIIFLDSSVDVVCQPPSGVKCSQHKNQTDENLYIVAAKWKNTMLPLFALR